MKMSFGVLTLLFSVLVLSGCASSGKKSGCVNCSTPVAAPQAVAAPVVPAAVEEVAPAVEEAPAKMTEEQIMAAVRK